MESVNAGKIQRTLGFKPGADLGKLHILVGRLGEDVVAEGNEVVLVGERHDSLRVVFRDREQRLEDAGDSLSETRREAVHDKMGVLLGHGRVRGGDVMAEGDIVEGHAECGAVGQMADDHGVRNAAVFVNEHEVGHALGEAGLDEILHDGVTTVKTDRVWEAEAEFLGVSQSLRHVMAGVMAGSIPSRTE